MKKKNRDKIKKEVRRFAETFMEYSSKILSSFERVQPNIRKAMPDTLNCNNIKINAYYSEDREHVMILFEEDIKNSFNFSIVKGNIIDSLDETGNWSRSKSAAIGITNSSGFIDSMSIKGFKPFDIVGDKNKIVISNLNLEFPNGKNKILNFGYILSYPIFKNIAKNEHDYIKNLIYVFWDYFRRENGKKLDSSKEKEKNNMYFKSLLDEMKKIIFDCSAKEIIIDNFLTNNPIILERCLDIKAGSLLPQIKLINYVKENFSQDMKPDIICQNIHEDWVIIDYKRAKRILKKEKTARADVKAEVHELNKQLKNYREYFNEEKHRKSFFEKTGYDIPSHPLAKGIIGIVPKENRNEFLRHIEDYPHWIEIITYNEIFTKFKIFCENSL